MDGTMYLDQVLRKPGGLGTALYLYSTAGVKRASGRWEQADVAHYILSGHVLRLEKSIIKNF